MKHLGDIELVKGKILNLKVDPVAELPTFDAEDESRICYHTESKKLYLNNGTSLVPIQIASQDSEPLIESLGTEWLNPDYSFNPTPFNQLTFLQGLSSDDSLLTVLQQFDAALVDISSIEANDIEEFEIEDPQAGDVIFFDGNNFVNAPITEIPEFAININLNSLADVKIEGVPADNDALFFESETNTFTNKKWCFRYENQNAGTTHVVTHNLDNLYCTVTIIATNTNTLVTNATITYNSPEQLTVTLQSSLPVIILVYTIPFQE